MTPALNAARTAFTCPRVSGIAAVLAGRCWVGLPGGLACFGIGSDEAGGVFVARASVMGMGLPRRLASSVAARSNQSNSRSSRYRMALGKSFGRTVRRGGRLVQRDYRGLFYSPMRHFFAFPSNKFWLQRLVVCTRRLLDA